MHDSIMTSMGVEHEQYNNASDNFGGNPGWVEANHYANSQHQSPIHEYGDYGFMQQPHHGLPIEPSFTRMPPSASTNTTHQQLLPLIMPSHPTWPSMLTNPTNYQPPPVAIPSASVPLKLAKLPAIHSTSTPRKTLTDADRRRMCQYHEDNPSIKQTEIGAMFGVERSTVSKVLRQKDKYLFPEDRSVSPVKRAKGKFPDIERALMNWVRNSQKKGIPLTDAVIREKAHFFATTVGSTESHIKANSTSWLEKFKQKNGIGSGHLVRRASETNVSETASLSLDLNGGSASQTPSGISPSSPDCISPLSGNKSAEDIKEDGLDNYLDFANGNYRHSNSQSSASLSSAFTDTAPSSFSGGPTSPTTPFAFSPDTGCGPSPFMPSQQARLPPPSASFQRPRSQTFPMLGIDPSFLSNTQPEEPSTPKYSQQTSTAPSSALDSPIHEMPQFGLDSAIASPPLHHSSSTSSMRPPTSTTPINSALSSPPSNPGSPTQDDARRALDTLLMYFNQAPTGLVEPQEYMTVVKLTEKLRLQPQLPGGLHRISENDGEGLGLKMEEGLHSSLHMNQS